MAEVIPFDPGRHRDAVVALWREVFGYQSARNEPSLVIDRKTEVADGLFFVAEDGSGEVIGTVMAGYDGHRGWIYSLAVAPSCQRGGTGSQLMGHAERALVACGCVKINLQILEDNSGVVEFYQKIGYEAEPRISMGKTLDQNIPVAD